MIQNKQKTYNFNAGPAMLPVPVMEKAKDEFLDYQGTGMSVMEMSHRGKHFDRIIQDAESLLRELMEIPETYSVIFFPGGATLQFSTVPLNLLSETETADYSVTGVFAKKAFEEARKFSPVRAIYDMQPENYTRVPEIKESDISPDAKYLYITSNNTIYGTRYSIIPKIKKIPLIADMTSEILSRRIDVSDFGLIFAGAQKNIGPSGLTVVIIKNSLLEIKKRSLPSLFDYKIIAKNRSLYNTPPTFSIYIAKLVFEWCRDMGGVVKLQELNEKKARVLYECIENSDLYQSNIQTESRSIMNVVFTLKKAGLGEKFNLEAERSGLTGLEGHRDVGGFRASIYNAMPIEGVMELIAFMQDFEKKNL